MPNNVKRNVSKIKGKLGAHPFSRKAVQIRRAMVYADNKADKAAKRDSAKASRLTKVFILQEYLCNYLGLALPNGDDTTGNQEEENDDDEEENDDKKEVEMSTGSNPTSTIPKPRALSVEEAHNLVLKVLNRNQEEITKLKSERRKGRPAPPKMTLLQDIQDGEFKEYNAGVLDLPLLTEAQNVTLFAEWDGDLNFLPRIKFHKYKKLSPSAKKTNEMDTGR